MAFKLLGKPAVLVAAPRAGLLHLARIEHEHVEQAVHDRDARRRGQPGGGRQAGFVLSLFGVSMMVGRFLTSTIKNLTAIGVKLIAGAAVVAVGAILLMI